MTHDQLKILRLWLPGVFLCVFYSLAGRITGEWSPLFVNLDDIKYSTPALILGCLYYALPLREYSNRRYYDSVNENLRSRLVEISGLTDNKEMYSWNKMRSIFYIIIDNDNSLTIKSRQAYQNGLIWTTVADIRAISALSLVLSIVLLIHKVNNSGVLCAMFMTLVLVSYLFSYLITKRHIRIGNEQLEIIDQVYREKLQNEMAKLDDRHI